MSNKSNGSHTRKPLTRMTAPELASATRGAEEINFDDTRPLTPDMAAAWDRAKRGRGRPRIGQGSEKVLISMEKRLLLVTDALARRNGLDRSKLIAMAIRQMLERETTEKEPTNSPVGELVGSSNLPPRTTSASRATDRKKPPPHR